MADLLQETESRQGRPLAFRVEAKRKDKRYPLKSMDVAALLGRKILDAFPRLVVDLTRPDVVLNVEIWPESALLVKREVAPRLHLGQGFLGLVARPIGFGLMQGCIERPAIQREQQVALPDELPFVKVDFHQHGIDLRLDGDGRKGLRVADGLHLHRHGPGQCGRDANQHGRPNVRLHLAGRTTRCGQRKHAGSENRSAKFPIEIHSRSSAHFRWECRWPGGPKSYP